MDEADSCEEAAVDAQEPPCKRSAFSRILGDDLEELTTRRSVLEKVNQEVENYLQTYLVDIDQSPLEWRRREKSWFPLLVKLARKLLCICATSVASERVFSAAGYIGSFLRSYVK